MVCMEIMWEDTDTDQIMWEDTDTDEIMWEDTDTDEWMVEIEDVADINQVLESYEVAGIIIENILDSVISHVAANDILQHVFNNIPI